MPHNYTLKSIPGQNMTQAEMERQCQLISNAADAIEEAGLNELNDREFTVIVNTKTLTARVVRRDSLVKHEDDPNAS